MSSDEWMESQRTRGPELTTDLEMDRFGVAELEPESILGRSICLQAIYSRDSRFDGRFFAGAASTRIYCRNVCPAPYANPNNIRLFASVMSAELAGFRPCKRCRPQAIPGVGAWLGTSAVVSRAIRLILEGALNGGSVEALAARLGLGSRQLRRLFVQHLGASPLKIATAHRVHLAKKLIDESGLPMTQIAFGSGFNSIREFNHAILLSTGQSPSELRYGADGSHPKVRSNGLKVRLPYRDPFDWANLIAFLKPRAIPGVEIVLDDSYRRMIEVEGVAGILTVRPDQGKCRLIVHLQTAGYEGLAQAVERVRRIFDLSADPIQIAGHLSCDPKLRALIKHRPGLRVPGVWDGFEAAVFAVLGQSLTRSGPRELMARLVQIFGTPVDTRVPGLNYLFPRPGDLAHADLSKAGISLESANIIRKLSSSALGRSLSFATTSSCRTLEQVVSDLRVTCGIDEITANYIAMRALGEPDAFPSNELKLRCCLTCSKTDGSCAQSIAEAERWRPWRAYAAMHLAQ